MPYSVKEFQGPDLHTIAFYNLENMFDTRDDPKTLDDDFTPRGFLRWTERRYRNKLKKLARSIAGIGKKSAGKYPVLVGVAEVENARVLYDLINTPPLRDNNYRFIHSDSPDERGIDTALIYHSGNFEVEYSEPLPLIVYNPDGQRDTTRDILYVRGKLNGEEVHIFVNHWPSRREGAEETAYKRIIAAETILGHMAAIEARKQQPNYIVMGDFNDGPGSSSLELLSQVKGLYNPMTKLLTPDRGSANYKSKWGLFDQILISHTFLDYKIGTHSYRTADIYDDVGLMEWKGRFKGNPFRTFAGRRYLGGYSDHFPVFVQLEYHAVNPGQT